MNSSMSRPFEPNALTVSQPFASNSSRGETLLLAQRWGIELEKGKALGAEGDFAPAGCCAPALQLEAPPVEPAYRKPLAPIEPFAWTQAWLLARISEWVNAAIRWLGCRSTVVSPLDHKVSLLAGRFQIGQALFLHRPWKRSVRIR